MFADDPAAISGCPSMPGVPVPERIAVPNSMAGLSFKGHLAA